MQPKSRVKLIISKTDPETGEIVQDDSAASVLFTTTYRFRYPQRASPLQTPPPLPDLELDLSVDMGMGFISAGRESNFRSTMPESAPGWALR